MADTEKVSFNMSVVDLGQVDLLVDQGFYSGRTDFFKTAVRNLLQTHAPTVKETVARELLIIGVASYNRRVLERLVEQGKVLDIRVVGLFSLSSDVTPELARKAIRSIRVHGTFKAPDEVKAALQDRME